MEGWKNGRLEGWVAEPCGQVFTPSAVHTPPPLGAPLSRGETMRFSAIMPRRGNIFYTLMEITLKSEAKSTCFPSREGMAAKQPGCVDPCSHASMHSSKSLHATMHLNIRPKDAITHPSNLPPFHSSTPLSMHPCNHASMLLRLFLSLLLSTTFLWSQPGVNILIKTNTPDAIVFLDEKKMGTTEPDGNIIIEQVPPGNHDIRIVKDGFLENRQIITVAELKNSFTFTLEKTPGNTGTTGNEGEQTPGTGLSPDLAIRLLIMIIITLALVLSLLAWLLRNYRRHDIIGKFELREILGKGGIATTYKAKDLEKKKIIALKVLDPTFITDKDLVYKFFCEGDVISKINREFPDAPVVKVSEFGRDREKSLGIPIIAMELVKGSDLLKMIKENTVGPVSRKLNIAREVARALVAAHQLGIFHGDITPDNIIVDRDKVTLIDFGVSLQHHDSYKNMDASVMGKPVYMSPEQCEGKPIDAKSDVYSLGVIMFFMFYGQPPFISTNPLEIMTMHRESPLPDLETPVPGDIKELIYRMLEKDPGKRPKTTEVEQTLEKLAQQYD